jgi:hypothetical protein
MTKEPADLDGTPPQDLSYAGSVVDKAIEFMVGQNISSLAIASALLGGAMGMLARSLEEEAIVGILKNAITSVQNGELRVMADTPPPSSPSS